MLVISEVVVCIVLLDNALVLDLVVDNGLVLVVALLDNALVGNNDVCKLVE